MRGKEVATTGLVEEQDDTTPTYEKQGNKGRKTLLFLGGAGLVGACIVGGAIKGGIDGFKFTNVASVENTISGGESEIIDFDPNIKKTCVTSATVGFTGAKNREEYKALGKTVAWSETTVDAEQDVMQCVDGEKIKGKLDRKTGVLTLDVQNKDAIYADVIIDPASIVTREDFSAGFATYQNLINSLKSTWGVQNLDFVKGWQESNSQLTSEQQTFAVIAGQEAALEKCRVALQNLAAPSIEDAIKDMYLPGRAIEAARFPGINADAIEVTVEGTPFADVKEFGNRSNVDENYKKLEDIAAKNDGFILQAGEMGECKVPEKYQAAANGPTVGGDHE